MPANDPISSPQIQRQIRLSEQTAQWHRELLDIKSPEETLQLEKARVESELQSARQDAELCADPRLRARHAQALDRISSVYKRVALEPGCNCKDKERQVIYERQVHEHQRQFPLDFVPTDAFRSAPISPGPCLTPLRRETRGTPPPSDAQGERGGEDSTSAPTSPRSAASSPPHVPKGDARPAASPKPDREPSELQHHTEEAVGPGEAGTNTNVAGDTVTDGEPRFSSAEDPLHNKRKATDDSLICTFRLSKQIRLDETRSATPSGEAEVHSTTQPQPDNPARCTIEFDDLYQDREGQYKHMIIPWEGRWYILRCDEHMHFGDNPVKGAAKHLSAKSHGGGTRDHSRAINVLGVEVLNCDREKQKMNNDAFEVALSNGYTPLNNPAAARRPQPRPQRPPTGNSRPRERRDLHGAVLSPVPGEIYLGCWGGLRDTVGIIVLPRDCFGDPSFADVGLEGSLATDTLLLEDVPKCYRTCPETGHIMGWEEGYEDAGERVEEREYPVMYFDGVKGLRKSSVAWLPVKDITVYDRDSWARTGGLISNYAYLQEFEAWREGARTAAERQGGLTSGDEASAGTAGAELQEPNVSPPPAQALGVVETPPETAPSSAAGPVPCDTQGRPADTTDEQRNPGTDPSSHATPPEQSTSVSRQQPSFTSTAFKPTQANIAGHAATNGDGVPSHKQAWPGARGSGSDRTRAATGDPTNTASVAPGHDWGRFHSLGSGNAAPMMHSTPSANYAGPHVRTHDAVEEAFHAAAVSQRAVASTASLHLPRDDRGAFTSRRLGDQGSRDEPIDIDRWEQSPTTPAFDSIPFKQSFEHSTATPRDPPELGYHWTMPDGRVVVTQYEAGEEPSVSGGAGEAGWVPEATMMPVHYQWLHSFDA